MGDIESMPFIEALRQLQYKIGKSNIFMVQVSLQTKSPMHTLSPQFSALEFFTLGSNMFTVQVRISSPKPCQNLRPSPLSTGFLNPRH